RAAGLYGNSQGQSSQKSLGSIDAHALSSFPGDSTNVRLSAALFPSGIIGERREIWRAGPSAAPPGCLTGKAIEQEHEQEREQEREQEAGEAGCCSLTRRTCFRGDRTRRAPGDGCRGWCGRRRWGCPR